MKFNQDEFGEVTNGEDTYTTIKTALASNLPVAIGWTDEEGSHFDILFTPKSFVSAGIFQGGINPQSDYFVSIMRRGAFAFDHIGEPLHVEYVAEKLRVRSEPLTTLLNNTIRIHPNGDTKNSDDSHI